jgi:uncharacterized membrane protein YgdD (TMEM256/DUF423 family)
MKAISQHLAFRISAVFGALAVGLGAFGAHALKDVLEQNGRADTWKTAVLYHLVHAVVMLLLASIKVWKPLPWHLFAAGSLLFSGSLYLLCLTPLSFLGPITPLGGIVLLGGWLALAFGREAPTAG